MHRLRSSQRRCSRTATPSTCYALFVDRHESYLPAEVVRVLGPGGRFVSQQCGGTHHADLNDQLGLPRPRYGAWRLAAAEAQLNGAGFVDVAGQEAFTETRIHDVGAISNT